MNPYRTVKQFAVRVDKKCLEIVNSVMREHGVSRSSAVRLIIRSHGRAPSAGRYALGGYRAR